MKKIIIGLAVVVTAVAAQAATMSWSVNAVQSSPNATVSAGWIAQLFASDVTYDYAKVKSGELTAAFEAATVSAGSTFRVNQTGVGSFEKGETASYYMVIYDATSVAAAKNYVISDVREATVNPSTGANISLAFGAMAGTSAATNAFYGQSWAAAGSAAPEPTSGLLLLLGMAGLALKRKHA